MKAKVRIPLIIVASVVAAIIVAVVVLCAVIVRPFKPFNSYDSVRLETSDTTVQISDFLQDADQKAAFEKGIKNTGFSVMHAMLELQYDYSPRFEMKDDPDSTAKKPPKIKTELTVSEVKSRTVASETQYVLEFWYAAEQSVKVEKETVKFDRLRMNVTTSNGEVYKVTVYPYLYEMTYGEGNPEVEDYRITPVILRLNTTKLYSTLGDVVTAMKK